MDRSHVDRGDQAAQGRLTEISRGLCRGEIVISDVLGQHDAIDIEIFACGIRAGQERLPLPSDLSGRHLSFAVPIERFPDVKFPCRLTGRIVQTDMALESDVNITGRLALWSCLLPFPARADMSKENQITVYASDLIADGETEIFELCEGETSLALSRVEGINDVGETTISLTTPPTVLINGSQSLSLVHRASGVALALDALPPAPMPLERPEYGDLVQRVERLEAALDHAYSDAFLKFALDIYRHIDLVTMVQRANFDREMAAMRKTAAFAPPADRPAEKVPSEIHIDLAGDILGYGLKAPETAKDGKSYRPIEPACGILMPGIRIEKAETWALRIQGIRLSDPDLLKDIHLRLNGHDIEPDLYRKPKATSWNITSWFSANLLLPTRNLLELRRGATKGSASLFLIYARLWCVGSDDAKG